MQYYPGTIAFRSQMMIVSVVSILFVLGQSPSFVAWNPNDPWILKTPQVWFPQMCYFSNHWLNPPFLFFKASENNRSFSRLSSHLPIKFFLDFLLSLYFPHIPMEIARYLPYHPWFYQDNLGSLRSLRSLPTLPNLHSPRAVCPHGHQMADGHGTLPLYHLLRSRRRKHHQIIRWQWVKTLVPSEPQNSW